MLEWLHRRETRSLSGKLTIEAKSDTNVIPTIERNSRSKPDASPSPTTSATTLAITATALRFLTIANPRWAGIRVGRSWWLTTLDPISHYFLRIWRSLAQLATALRLLLATIWPNGFLRHERSVDLDRYARTLDAIDALDAAGSVLRLQSTTLRLFRLPSIFRLCERLTLELGSCSRIPR